MPKALRTPRKAAPQGKILRRDGRAERVCINEDTSCITGTRRCHRSSRAPVIASDRTARADEGDLGEPSSDARAVPGSESPPAGGRRPVEAVAPAEGGASGGRKAEARAQRAATPTSPEASSGARSGLPAGMPAASGASPTTARRWRRAQAEGLKGEGGRPPLCALIVAKGVDVVPDESPAAPRRYQGEDVEPHPHVRRALHRGEVCDRGGLRLRPGVG